jgi:hypothetical protein
MAPSSARICSRLLGQRIICVAANTAISIRSSCDRPPMLTDRSDAEGGGGGICGLPGYGGPPGSSGTISVTKPGEWCKPYGDVVTLPDLPKPPRMVRLEDVDDPPEGDPQAVAAYKARAEETIRLHREAMAAYNAESARVANERDRLPKLFPHWPDSQKMGANGQLFANPDERAADGHPGSGGPETRTALDERVSVRNARGRDGQVRQSDLKRNPKTAAVTKPAAHPAIQNFPKVGYTDLTDTDLRDKGDIQQLEMVLSQTRSRYLLTPLPLPAGECEAIVEVLQWLVLLTTPPAATTTAPTTVTTTVTTPATNDKPRPGRERDNTLRESALATLVNIRNDCNIFGKDAQFAALGSFERYKTDLEKMLTFLKEVEKVYTTLNATVNATAEKQKYLTSVVAAQDGLITRLSALEDDTVRSLKTTLTEVITLEDSRDKLANAVEESVKKFKDQISSKLGLAPGDIWNLFTQLSFTNREVTHEGALLVGGAAAAGAMILSQVDELATKAIENVATDTGGSVNKNYVIQRMQYLGKEVKTVAGLKETRDGLLKTNPSAEYRLQATREQVESICSNFYESIPEAKEVSGTLDAFIEAVAARNAKVEEYNQELSQLVYVRAELDKLKVQRGQASTALQAGASPGLPVMANFFTALRRHAQERCIEQLYFASRVYTLESLDPYDVFADVLGKLASGAQPGDLNAAALDTALIDMIGASLTNRQKHKTSRSQFVPQGDHCWLRLTPGSAPLLFPALKLGKPGTFVIPPAAPDTTIDRNPFAGMSDIRLTNIRCIAEGMTTSDDVQYIKITHTGLDSFITEDGRKVQLKHNPVTHASVYNAKTGEHTGKGALDEDHHMIGPCCMWTLEIPAALNKNLKLADLKSIKVEFEGVMRAFVPSLTSVSASRIAGV